MKNKATIKGLEYWYISIFQKLGWMILAKYYNKTKPIEYYKYNIEEFKKHIKMKIKSVQEKDRLEDLKILEKNISILSNFVNSILK